MIAEKKPSKNKVLPTRSEKPIPTESKAEFDSRSKLIIDRMKARRVNYIVKDLPMY